MQKKIILFFLEKAKENRVWSKKKREKCIIKEVLLSGCLSSGTILVTKNKSNGIKSAIDSITKYVMEKLFKKNFIK